MKRELKFRAWDTILNRMYPAFEMKEYMSLNEMGQDNIVPQTANEIELMQHIGCKDVKGIEIYEGDILYWNHLVYFSRKGEKYEDQIAEVIWAHAGFSIRMIKGAMRTLDFETSQVIGNIYENPELII